MKTEQTIKVCKSMFIVNFFKLRNIVACLILIDKVLIYKTLS